MIFDFYFYSLPKLSVYSSSILPILTPAINGMLSEEGSFLYCAPDSGRDGMADFISALESIDIVCVELKSVPDFMYDNPLVDTEDDNFVLHFYDLAAKSPHSLYHFRRKSAVNLVDEEL